MKKVFFLLAMLLSLQLSFAQKKAATTSTCEQYQVFDPKSTPDIGIVISTPDAETVYNALRLATYAQKQGDKVVIFLVGKGLDGYQTKDEVFPLGDLQNEYVSNGGQVIACATCAKVRGTEEIAMCTISGMKDFYNIVKQSKKVVTF